MLNKDSVDRFIAREWAASIVDTLKTYITIPNESPAFDSDWANAGYMDAAVALFADWARTRIERIAGATLEVLRLPGRTPLLMIDIPGAGDDVTLLYGHLDKQPEMFGWSDGKGPWTPVLEGERLYGRGGADDGYAMFAALTAILALHHVGAKHPRCVVLIEGSEESGSPDLPAYMDRIAPRIGAPALVICLDSGCGDYERLWLTTSLRGLAGGTLRVDVLDEGIHSGDASGVIASSFRILRRLISRLEDEDTGEIRLDGLYATIPGDRKEQARGAATVLGADLYEKFPLVQGMTPVRDDVAELILNRTWRPALAVTGLDGAPSCDSAGSVLRPFTSAQLGMRLPPSVDAKTATDLMAHELERDPPYGARITFTPSAYGSGWNAAPTAPWLMRTLAEASNECWGAPMAMVGEGGTIPFMAMLGKAYPKAQFVVTGVLGPHSNAHGPNEFLHLPTAVRITQAIARVLAAAGAQSLE